MSQPSIAGTLIFHGAITVAPAALVPVSFSRREAGCVCRFDGGCAREDFGLHLWRLPRIPKEAPFSHARASHGSRRQEVGVRNDWVTPTGRRSNSPAPGQPTPPCFSTVSTEHRRWRVSAWPRLCSITWLTSDRELNLGLAGVDARVTPSRRNRRSDGNPNSSGPLTELSSSGPLIHEDFTRTHRS